MAGKVQKNQVSLKEEGENLVLGGRFRPDFSRPLATLGGPGIRAFAVNDPLGNADEFYCALCEPGIYIRHEKIDKLIDMMPRGIRLPHASSPIRMKDGRHYQAIIFDNAGARPIMERYPDGVVPERDLVHKIIPDLIQCLVDLHPGAVAHRGIRPEAILVRPDGEVVLDQCVIHLPGEQQPEVYESIPAALAVPGGRGDGVPSDDYHAFGVAILHMVSGEAPGSHLDAVECQAQRITRGSYATLVNRRRFSSALQALLIGTMADDASRRWTVENLKAWVSGHWDMPRPTTGGIRAARPFLFLNRDYHSPELLAWAFQNNPADAAQAITSGRVDKWVRNVLEDNQAADLIENSLGMYEGDNDGADSEMQQLVSRICMALDPAGPLRYRNLVITPSGIPGTIWTAFREGDKARLGELHELMGTTLLNHWQATGSRSVKSALPNLVNASIKSIMYEAHRPGFGLERALYELLPQTACLGDDMTAFCPMLPGDVLVALEQLAATRPGSELQIDRHAAAFILAKDRSADGLIRAIGKKHPTRVEELVAVGDLLAYLQRTFMGRPLPRLTGALANALTPATKDISSKVRRMVLAQIIEKFSGSGSISDLVRELNIKQTIAQDLRERAQARQRLKSIDKLIEIGSSNSRTKALLAQRRGYRYARLLSMSVAFTTVFYFAMYEML